MGRGAGRGGDEETVVVVATCGCATLVLTVVLVACSFSTLEPTEFGLEYNGVSKTLNKAELYENGRHFIGLAHYFIKYPKTQQTIKFAPEKDADHPSLRSRSRDGMKITIGASLQFTINKNVSQIVQLYEWFGPSEDDDQIADYKRAYIRVSRAVLRNAAASFKSFDFFLQRDAVIKKMTDDITRELDRIHCKVITFNLLSIGVPRVFQGAIQRTEVAKQDILTAVNEYAQKQEVANLKIAEAKISSQIKIREAAAKANGYLAQVDSNVLSLAAKLKNEAVSYQMLANELGLDVEALLQYIWTNAVASHGGDGTSIALAKPTKTFGLSRTPVTSEAVPTAVPGYQVYRQMANVTACKAKSKECRVSYNLTDCQHMSVSATTCALATDKASCVAEQKPNINAQGISCTTDPKTNTGKYCGCVYTPGTAKTMVCTDTATKNVLTCISTNSPVVNPKVCTSS